ncbi:MAG: EF-hand domain-containing protein [Armatimonadota bacterium]
MPPVDPEERRARMFDRMDANHDGKLTRDELPGPGADSMMQADTNGDGAISRQEFDKAAEAMREAFARGPGGGAGFGGPGGGFERMDANGDGVLKGDEIPERFRERWMQGDANGDGALTREELQKLWEARRGQGPSGGGRGER